MIGVSSPGLVGRFGSSLPGSTGLSVSGFVGSFGSGKYGL